MELKVCPNPRASASAAEFNVSPARRESSSKTLFEPLEMLNYCWVFPLRCCPRALRSHRGLRVLPGVADPAPASLQAAAVHRPAQLQIPQAQGKNHLLQASKHQGFSSTLF